VNRFFGSELVLDPLIPSEANAPSNQRFRSGVVANHLKKQYIIVLGLTLRRAPPLITRNADKDLNSRHARIPKALEEEKWLNKRIRAYEIYSGTW
jgi:hypothetical protein